MSDFRLEPKSKTEIEAHRDHKQHANDPVLAVDRINTGRCDPEF